MSKTVIFFLITLTVLMVSCAEEVFPKPTAYLRLNHSSDKIFFKTNLNCPYEFELNTKAIVKQNKKCWLKITYPELNASVDITYRKINNNLREIFIESEKLTTKHTKKADEISFIPYQNNEAKVYGKITDVTGNAASPIQFHLTDSTKHFITGALYFNTTPNYDSIYPSIKYLEKDIVRLMETLRWKN